MQDFQENLCSYVELLVAQGCNVQPGQQVWVSGEPACIPLIELAAQACYRRGARYVDYEVVLPRMERYHLLGAPAQRLGYVPGYKTVRVDQLVDGQGAALVFRSQDEPDLYEDLDADGQRRLNQMTVARREAVRRFREEGVLERQVGWCLGAVPSPKWAARVFPELTPEAAVEALWTDIFRMTGADQPDCLERWATHLDRLSERARRLNELGIRELHFLNPGQGTDLKVRLSEVARWVAGREDTAYGVPVCLNIPTFEVFTTPDWRGTTGTVATTRPVMINGTLVEGLRLRFEEGEIVEVQADKNGSAYEALIQTAGDASARRLGEVALVGVDSPIFQSGRIYHHTLFDENAACHIATGMAYTVGVEDGDSLPPERLDEIGFNRQAKTHQDIMISDATTDVFADGRPILRQGRWVEGF